MFWKETTHKHLTNHRIYSQKSDLKVNRFCKDCCVNGLCLSLASVNL